ncbi:MAG: hypothetical protein WDM91_20025 [Rhizomicrobium sp.]
MQSTASLSMRSLSDRLSVQVLALLGMLLVLLLAAHVTQCADETDNHGVVRSMRSAERLIDFVSVHLELETDRAAGSDGKSQIDAALAVVTLLVLAICAALFQRADGAPLLLATARNTALAHRKLTALLI